MIQHSLFSRNICVLGLDIAARVSGVVVLEVNDRKPRFHTHLISLPSAANTAARAARLVSMRDTLLDILTTYPLIQLAAVENYSFDSEHRLADLAEVGGVVRLLLQERHIPFVEVPPKSLKKFVTGSGSADKAKVIYGVKTHYGLDTNDDNIADAAGLAMFAGVVLTKASTRRCELESVYTVTHPSGGKNARKRANIRRGKPESV